MPNEPTRIKAIHDIQPKVQMGNVKSGMKMIPIAAMNTTSAMLSKTVPNPLVVDIFLAMNPSAASLSMQSEYMTKKLADKG